MNQPLPSPSSPALLAADGSPLVVVITGASSGIGAALAQQCAALGAKVVLVARRERELAAVAQSCGGEALVVVADVCRRADHARVLAAALERFGKVDVWVNNAGRGITKLASQLTDEDFDEMMLVNTKSALYGMQVVLPHFVARKGGQVINVSSMLGRIPFSPVRSAYCAAKHALNSLTASFRAELASQGVGGVVFSSVHPGVVATDFGNSALHGGPDSRSFPNSQTAEEVAAVIVQTMRERKVDVYTRTTGQKQVIDYYAAADMAEAERAYLPRR